MSLYGFCIRSVNYLTPAITGYSLYLEVHGTFRAASYLVCPLSKSDLRTVFTEELPSHNESDLSFIQDSFRVLKNDRKRNLSHRCVITRQDGPIIGTCVNTDNNQLNYYGGYNAGVCFTSYLYREDSFPGKTFACCQVPESMQSNRMYVGC